MDITKAVVVYRKSESSRLKAITDVLKAKGIGYKAIERDSLKKGYFNGYDMVISFGGDGTFLKAASFIDDITPLLGVDSMPGTREAFFSRATINNFSQKISRRFKVVSLRRLEASINGKALPKLALNEFLITTKEPHHTAIYRLDGELQQSSGVLIGTAAGSTGWTKSAGGKVLPLRSKKFQYIVREPYFGKVYKPTKLNAVLEADDSVRIESCMCSGIIVADSSCNIFMFNRNDKIEVRVADKPLQFVEV